MDTVRADLLGGHGLSWLTDRAQHRKAPRPYTVDALAVAIGLNPNDDRLTSQLVTELQLSRGWVLRCRTLGLTYWQADDWATRAGIHPTRAWPRFADDLHGVALVNANKQTCVRGHPLDRVNTRGERYCSVCHLHVVARYKKTRKSLLTAHISLNAADARHPGRMMTLMDTTEPEGTDWMTVAETARLLRVHPDAVYDACSAGTMAHVRVGRVIRINRAALTAPTPRREAM